jgi:hypothetical protein
MKMNTMPSLLHIRFTLSSPLAPALDVPVGIHPLPRSLPCPNHAGTLAHAPGSSLKRSCLGALQDAQYPQLHRYILHPCVSWPGEHNACGGLHAASAVLRFESYLSMRKVVLLLVYEVRTALPDATFPPPPQSPLQWCCICCERLQRICDNAGWMHTPAVDRLRAMLANKLIGHMP